MQDRANILKLSGAAADLSLLKLASDWSVWVHKNTSALREEEGCEVGGCLVSLHSGFFASHLLPHIPSRWRFDIDKVDDVLGRGRPVEKQRMKQPRSRCDNSGCKLRQRSCSQQCSWSDTCPCLRSAHGVGKVWGWQWLCCCPDKILIPKSYAFLERFSSGWCFTVKTEA